MNSPNKTLIGSLGATLVVVGLLFAIRPAAVTAAIVTPTVVPANPTCPAGTIELKVEPVADGTFSDGTLSVTIDVKDTASGPVFDFDANIGVDAVIVKGGPDGNVYLYNPEVTSDTDCTRRSTQAMGNIMA